VNGTAVRGSRSHRRLARRSELNTGPSWSFRNLPSATPADPFRRSGTEGSNPPSSTGESGTNLTSSPWRAGQRGVVVGATFTAPTSAACNRISVPAPDCRSADRAPVDLRGHALQGLNAVSRRPDRARVPSASPRSGGPRRAVAVPLGPRVYLQSFNHHQTACATAKLAREGGTRG
jgi:hypothetical protein